MFEKSLSYELKISPVCLTSCGHYGSRYEEFCFLRFSIASYSSSFFVLIWNLIASSPTFWQKSMSSSMKPSLSVRIWVWSITFIIFDDGWSRDLATFSSIDFRGLDGMVRDWLLVYHARLTSWRNYLPSLIDGIGIAESRADRDIAFAWFLEDADAPFALLFAPFFLPAVVMIIIKYLQRKL